MNDRTYTGEELLMLMLDSAITGIQMFTQVPKFRLQAEFVLSGNEDNTAKRLAFHALLLNVMSDLIVQYNNSEEQKKVEDHTDEQPS